MAWDIEEAGLTIEHWRRVVEFNCERLCVRLVESTTFRAEMLNCCLRHTSVL
jgi:hypothetical protein